MTSRKKKKKNHMKFDEKVAHILFTQFAVYFIFLFNVFLCRAEKRPETEASVPYLKIYSCHVF